MLQTIRVSLFMKLTGIRFNTLSYSTQLTWLAFLSIAISISFHLTALTSRALNQNQIQKQIEKYVLELVASRLMTQIDHENPSISKSEKEQLVKERVKQVIARDSMQFNQLRQNLFSAFQDARETYESRKNYLKESDPYYYYGLTKQLVEKGKYFEKLINGRFFNPMRFGMEGTWDWFTLHPYLGFFWYSIFKFFGNADLVKALCFFPVFFTAGIVLAYFFAARMFSVRPYSIFIGSLTLVLSPVVIQRTTYGWYDTDVYNYLFPCMILGILLRGINSKRWWAYSVLASLVTFLYSLFWIAHEFIVIWVCVVSLIGFIAGFFLRFKERNRFLGFAFLYLFLSVLWGGVFFGFSQFGDVISNHLQGVQKMVREGVSSDIWPTSYYTTVELLPGTFRRIIHLSGNYISFLIGLLGCATYGIHLARQQKKLEMAHYLGFVLIFLIVFAMAFKSERFSNTWVIPLAFCVMFGFEWLMVHNWKFNPIVKNTVVSIVFIFPLLFGAQFSVRIPNTIMNDTWHSVLLEINQKTPANSIVNSWWPPGYFIMSVANRKAAADGGGQGSPHNMLIAKALYSADQYQSAGLFRMVNLSGNQSFDYLNSLGFSLTASFDLIMEIVSLPREQAVRMLREKLNDEQIKTFLKLTHGEGKPIPTYVLIYNELVDDSRDQQIMAFWDFKRAQILKDFSQLDSEFGYGSDYYGDAEIIIRGFRKYQPAANLAKRENDFLFFSNGLILNLSLMDAVIDSPEQKIRARPWSLYYLDQGQLVERKYPEAEAVSSSALIFKSGDDYRSVLADRDLIKSMLFRLYYLKGEGLNVFKPFILKNDPKTKQSIYVFEIDWKKFENRF